MKAFIGSMSELFVADGFQEERGSVYIIAVQLLL